MIAILPGTDCHCVHSSRFVIPSFGSCENAVIKSFHPSLRPPAVMGVSRNPQKKLDAGLKTAGMTRGEMGILFCGRALGTWIERSAPHWISSETMRERRCACSQRFICCSCVNGENLSLFFDCMQICECPKEVAASN